MLLLPCGTADKSTRHFGGTLVGRDGLAKEAVGKIQEEDRRSIIMSGKYPKFAMLSKRLIFFLCSLALALAFRKVELLFS